MSQRLGLWMSIVLLVLVSVFAPAQRAEAAGLSCPTNYVVKQKSYMPAPGGRIHLWVVGVTAYDSGWSYYSGWRITNTGFRAVDLHSYAADGDVTSYNAYCFQLPQRTQ